MANVRTAMNAVATLVVVTGVIAGAASAWAQSAVPAMAVSGPSVPVAAAGAPPSSVDAVLPAVAPIPALPAAALQAGAISALRVANGQTPQSADDSFDYTVPDDIDLAVAPPVLPTQADALIFAKRMAANRRMKKPRKVDPQLFLKTQTADGRLVYWQTGILSLDISGLKGGNRNLSQAADFKLVLPALSMDAKLTASAGKEAGSADLWQKQVAEVEMHVNVVPKTQVTLNGSEEYGQTYRDPSSIGDSGGPAHLIQSDKRSVSLTATVSPLENTTVSVGATGYSQTTKDSTETRDDKATTVIETQSEKAYVTASWQPLPWASFELTAREHNSGVLWRAKTTKSGAYRSDEVRAAMMLNLGDASLNVSLEDSTDDYNPDTFVAYASNAALKESVPVKPDRAVKLRTELTQKIGLANVSAAYTAERDGLSTEYGFSGRGIQVPVSTVLKRRDTVDVSVNMPLESLGLEDTRVAGAVTWRDSEVLDPLTGQYRRASGETPSNVRLRLEKTLPGKRLSLGLRGDLSAGQTSYQTQEISQTAASQKLGAYFAYKPDAFELDLDVDGLVGTPETVNYLYDGSRLVHQFPKVQTVPSQGPTVRLSIKRNF